jgi:hypothetical protein
MEWIILIVIGWFVWWLLTGKDAAAKSMGGEGPSDSEIRDRIATFEPWGEKAVTLVNVHTDYVCDLGRGAVVQHLTDVRMMLHHVQKEFDVMTDLVPRCRNRELREYVQMRYLDDLQYFINVFNAKVGILEAWLRD